MSVQFYNILIFTIVSHDQTTDKRIILYSSHGFEQIRYTNSE